MEERQEAAAVPHEEGERSRTKASGETQKKRADRAKKTEEAPKKPSGRRKPRAAATPQEVLLFFSEVLRDEERDTRERMRAAELLGKHLHLFDDRQPQDSRLEIVVEPETRRLME